MQTRGRLFAWTLLFAGFCFRTAWVQTAPPPAPPVPAIQSLQLEPASLTLCDGRDARKVLVTGITATGERIDLTSAAALKTDASCIAVDSEGYIEGRAKGEAVITVTAAGRTAELKVVVQSAEVPSVRFVRDVLPTMSRLGCNAGTCHGAAQGKNGFKLSLRGYDPDDDYESLIFDISGRRFNRVIPEESLMLLKPVNAVPHMGGQVTKPDSRYYRILLDWIKEGTRPESITARAVKLDILPKEETVLDLPGRSQQLLVLATYADGRQRDVTREAIVSSSDNEILNVKDTLATAVRRGEASALVRYEGNYATKLLTVMGDRKGFAWKPMPVNNFIDEHVNAKLRKMKILPSELTTDAEFVRRLFLDLTGMPPTAERAKAFAEMPDPAKRDNLIDELIGGKEFVDHWTNKWADLLQCNSEALGKKGVWSFRGWIRHAIAENKPYDAFARELLTAQGSAYHDPAVNYLRALRDPGKISEDVSQTFLAIRFNCNKCHDHPFERWTQNQYYEMAAYFARVGIKKGTLGQEIGRNATGDNIKVAGEEIVFRKYDGGEMNHLKTGRAVAPKVPFGQAKPCTEEGDRRENFADWMTSKNNEYFAKAYVNRLWSYFVGRGIIDPVDDIRAGNPESNPALLRALTDEFLKSNFDIRHMMRIICRSRTYQLSVVANEWNRDDNVNFSHARPRRLTAEQLEDALAVATGVRAKFAGLPEGIRAVEVADGAVGGGEFLKLFGRPERKSACECERRSNIFTLSHTMNLINGPMVNDAITSPAGRFSKLVEAEKDDAKLIEGIYYSVLNRPPKKGETDGFLPLFAEGKRLVAAQDLAWALINSEAFYFNR